MGSIRQAAAVQEARPWAIAPFWQQLNHFFLFPLQKQPLLQACALALCSYGILVGYPWMLAVVLSLMVAVSRCAFRIAALASRGVIHSHDYRPELIDPAWKWLPWKFFGVLLAYALLINYLSDQSKTLGMAATFVVSLLIPATLMVLINTCSLRSAINPLELLGTIVSIGKSYWLLCLFLFLLQEGSPLATELLLKVAPELLVLPVISFVVIYFAWVMAAMIGYVMYQHHADLDIDPLLAPELQEQDGVDPQISEAKRRDSLVAQLVQNGDMDEAVALAREWQRARQDGVADHRRYFRVLKLTDDLDTLTAQAQQFIPLLLEQQRTSEALEVWSSCTKRKSDFRIPSAEHTFSLAQQAFRAGKAKYALMLLRSFEKQFPGDALVPQALELMVQAFKQGLNAPVQAVRVYLHLKDRYPQHPSTQEAEWLLRDELEKVSVKL